MRLRHGLVNGAWLMGLSVSAARRSVALQGRLGAKDQARVSAPLDQATLQASARITSLADDQLVRADIAQHDARLLVEKVEVEKLI